MKRIITFITVAVLSMSIAFASDWKIRLTENEYGYLEVQMRCINAGLTPNSGDPLSGMTFQIYWPTSYSSDIELICTSNDYNITDGLGALQTTGANNWREYYINGAPIACPTTWVTNEWETITTYKVSSGSGSGDFTIANDLELGAGLNWQYGTPVASTYHPDVDGSVSSYDFPTIVYDLVWTGAGTPSAFQDGHSWSLAGNWEDECGGTGATPTSNDNCFIPASLSNYPENVYLALLTGQTGLAKNVRIETGAEINFGIEATKPELLNITESLKVYGTLNIMPNAGVTTGSSTYLNAANCLVIQSTSGGTGSFIDNGTITYGGSGTAKVQTFITNSAGVGNFDIHQVGPTVDEENYTGSGTGAFLGAFDIVTLDTWVYKWDESADLVNGWANIHLVTDEIHSGEGVGISTTDNSNHTLEMTGELITGNVTNALTYSNNHYELISNPYPSSVDFDALATANSSFILNKYWIYDPAANNYVTRAAGVGGAQYTQVGQGIFVETSQAGTFTFSNAQRSHSNDAFRSTVANMLTVNVTGGLSTYKDEMVVRFEQDATNGYDVDIESIKWNSMNGDATMIRSIIEDGTELAINVLPLLALQPGTMTSVPMHFNCGYNAEYTLSFFDMESFETGTEIWLEDKLVGDEWISINNDPDYTFAANANEPADRFIIHFFGPTSVDEYGMENTIDIYSYRQYATVRNNTNEIIKDIVVYSLSGELIRKIEPSHFKLNKFWVADNMGYYIVRVNTDQNVYTNKVFVTN